MHIALSRRILLIGILLVIIIFAVALRLGAGALRGPAAAWPSMQASYLDIAVNIGTGTGYFNTLTPVALEQLELRPYRLPPFDQLDRDPSVAHRPTRYILPGYPFLLAPLIAATGETNVMLPRLFNAVWDGVFGPTLAYIILAVLGLRLAGLIAAGFYAIHVPFIVMTTRVMPDALIPALTLASVACLILGFRYRREGWGVAAAGAVLGVGCYFRGEMLVIVPVFSLVAFFASARHFKFRARIALAALPVVAWFVVTTPMALLSYQAYGDLSWSRPGLGLLVWQGIGEQSNPWGIEASDEAADALLKAHGLQIGTPEGDRFLLLQAIGHFVESPGFFLKSTFLGEIKTVGRSLAVVHGLRSRFGREMDYSSRLAFLLVAIVGAALMLKRHRLLAGVLFALWLSMALPFSILRSEWRFLTPMVIAYIISVAYFVDYTIRWLTQRAGRLILWKAIRIIGMEQARIKNHGSSLLKANSGITPTLRLFSSWQFISLLCAGLAASALRSVPMRRSKVTKG